MQAFGCGCLMLYHFPEITNSWCCIWVSVMHVVSLAYCCVTVAFAWVVVPLMTDFMLSDDGCKICACCTLDDDHVLMNVCMMIMLYDASQVMYMRADEWK